VSGGVILTDEQARLQFDVIALRLPDGTSGNCARGSLVLLMASHEEQARVLAFYADENNWTQPTPWGGRIHDDESKAIADGGKRARAALAGDTEEVETP
jgi:hypothetical protein